MKRVGLFGGSFDPIHNAHTYIAQIAIEQLELDELQFIPTQNNPWKDSSCASANDRLCMIQLAIKNYPKMAINTIELDQVNEKKNYTIETIVQLKKIEPDTEYFYIMGMDQASLFYQWKEAKKISELVQLVAFERELYQINKKNINEFHYLLLKNEPILASSTDIRNGNIQLLNREVLKYITNQGLYLETMIKSKMSKKRWLHTCSVAKLASDIAKKNGLNDKQAYIAGMFHDIAKEMDYNLSKNIMENHFLQYIDKPKAIWHQWVSRYICENEYLINDSIILDAIEHHTTASIHMSAIGKCVYVADKLDPLRGYDSSIQIEICQHDIHQGFRNSLNDFYEFSIEHNRDIDKYFYEIYDFYITKGEM